MFVNFQTQYAVKLVYLKPVYPSFSELRILVEITVNWNLFIFQLFGTK